MTARKNFYTSTSKRNYILQKKIAKVQHWKRNLKKWLFFVCVKKTDRRYGLKIMADMFLMSMVKFCITKGGYAMLPNGNWQNMKSELKMNSFRKQMLRKTSFSPS